MILTGIQDASPNPYAGHPDVGRTPPSIQVPPSSHQGRPLSTVLETSSIAAMSPPDHHPPASDETDRATALEATPDGGRGRLETTRSSSVVEAIECSGVTPSSGPKHQNNNGYQAKENGKTQSV